MILHRSRRQISRKQRRSRKINKKGGEKLILPPLYVVYGRVTLNDIRKAELCSIVVDLRSARLVADAVIPNMVNQEFIDELGQNNFFVQIIAPNIHNGHLTAQVERLQPGRDNNDVDDLVTDLDDETTLYFVRGRNGVIKSIYTNLEMAERNYPGVEIERLNKNNMNWNSVLFQ